MQHHIKYHISPGGKGDFFGQKKRRLPSWEAVLLRFYLAGLTMRLMSLFFTRMVLTTVMPSVAF